MKKIVVTLIALMFISSSLLAHETLRSIVKEYQKANREVVIVIPNFLIRLGIAFSDLEREEKEMLKQIEDMKIVICENGYQKRNFKSLDEGIINGNFVEVMSVTDNAETVRMIMNKKSKRKSEMLMVVENNNENVLILFDFRGEPDFKKLISLAN